MRSLGAKTGSAILCALCLSVVGGARAADEPADESSIGVVPFATSAPPGVSVPDIATLLADRLSTAGIARVVGPGEVGAVATAEPSDAEVRAWAARARVGALLVGRTTRIGNVLSIDARLRSGATGEVSGTFVREIGSPGELDPAINALVKQIKGTLQPSVAAAGPDAGAPSPPRRPSSGGAGASGQPFGFSGWNSDKPLSIESEELEAIQSEEGGRRLVFRKNVRVVQGDMRMQSSTLEAIYPEHGNQPDRLVASAPGKGVHIQQRNQDARCAKVIYERVKDKLICQGNAVVQDGDNRLTGDTIEIDLKTEKVTVKGGAYVLIQPNSLEKDGQGAGQ